MIVVDSFQLQGFTKTNLGCGFDKREGFLNVDMNAFHHPDLVCDITALYPLPSGHFEHVVAKDVLEHIPRFRTRNALREWNRILKLGGLLELQVPNVIGLLHELELAESQSVSCQEQWLTCLFGTQSYSGDFHFTGFTELTLRAVLASCGFDVVALESRDNWLFVVSARKRRESGIDPIYKLDDESFVDSLYRRLLRRAPDTEGRDHKIGLLKSGAAREAVVEGMMSSSEYMEAHDERDLAL
jgi:SAM-dependent methyltransferase